MKLRSRRILTICIAAIYIAVALALLTYAAGWRFNTSTKSFNQVGAILIDTKPSHALVTVNEKLLKKDTPLTIKNLIPDDYIVIIHKDGFYNWTSPVRVESAQTSRLTDITLIKKNDPQTLPYSNVDSVKLSAEKEYAALISSDRIAVINLGEEDVKKQFDLRIIPESVIWSPYSYKILAQDTKKNFFIIDADNQENLLSLRELFNREFISVIWSCDEADVLYASDGTDVHRLNIFQKTSTKLFSHRDIVFASTDFLLQKEGSDLIMIDNSGNPTKDIRMPDTSNILVTPLSDRMLLLHDTINEHGYLFDKQNIIIEKLNFSMHNTGSIINNQLLVHNGYEIFSWNWRTDTQTLLLRTSQPISQPDWIVSGKYVVFIQNGSIRIIESTTRNQNSYTIPFPDIVTLNVINDPGTILVLSEGSLYTLSF